MSKTITTQLEWLESRQHGVGSSDSPILALPPEKVFKKTALDIYISKKSPVKEDDSDNPNFRRGHVYEPLAIKLAEAKLGQKIYAPKNDDERWNLFQSWHPDIPYMFADFDGLREDGWVVEVKSPMQRVADSIRVHGLKDYYQIQGQHLVELASVCELPFLGKLPDGCPGVCFVVYECEKIDVQLYEVPRNELMIEAILANAQNFWVNHVMKDTPPLDGDPCSPIVIPNTKAEYLPVDGAAWDEAVAQFAMAKEGEASAKGRMDVAKERIIKALGAAGLTKAITGRGWKFSNTTQAGSKRLNLKLLQADHPQLDLDKYKQPGKPSTVFRNYGPKDQAKWGDDTLDGQLLTLKDELERFSKQSVDPEIAIEVFDELRARSDLYTRMLALELEGIQNGLVAASEAITKPQKEKADE